LVEGGPGLGGGLTDGLVAPADCEWDLVTGLAGRGGFPDGTDGALPLLCSTAPGLIRLSLVPYTLVEEMVLNFDCEGVVDGDGGYLIPDPLSGDFNVLLLWLVVT